MLDDLFAGIASCVLLLSAMVMRPTRATCPGDHMYVATGIRTAGDRLGQFCCAQPPIGGDDDVLTGKNTSIQPPGFLCSQIHCTNGLVPVVRDHRHVACGRR